MYYPLMLRAYPHNICALQVRFVAQGAEDRVLFVEQVEHGIKFRDPSFVHNQNTIVVSCYT